MMKSPVKWKKFSKSAILFTLDYSYFFTLNHTSQQPWNMFKMASRDHVTMTTKYSQHFFQLLLSFRKNMSPCLQHFFLQDYTDLKLFFNLRKENYLSVKSLTHDITSGVIHEIAATSLIHADRQRQNNKRKHKRYYLRENENKFLKCYNRIVSTLLCFSSRRARICFTGSTLRLCCGKRVNSYLKTRITIRINRLFFGRKISVKHLTVSSWQYIYFLPFCKLSLDITSLSFS